MNDERQNRKPQGPVSLAETLISTLKQEQDAMSRLSGEFARQLQALRQRDAGGINDATDGTNEALHVLGRLRQMRERQSRLLGRVLNVNDQKPSITTLAESLHGHAGGDEAGAQLMQLRSMLHEEARAAQQRCRDVEFSLHFAMDIGRELLHALQGFDAGPSKMYTASGSSSPSQQPRSLLNRMG